MRWFAAWAFLAFLMSLALWPVLIADAVALIAAAYITAVKLAAVYAGLCVGALLIVKGLKVYASKLSNSRDFLKVTE